MIGRVLAAEFLKLKRTNALRLVVIAPLTVVILMTFLISQAPESTLGRQRENNWFTLTRIMLSLWTLLVLPLYIALQTALIAALEHSDNQWKALLARPVPRWTIYVSKLIVAAVFLALSIVILVAGIFASGALLSHLQLELHFTEVPYSDIIGNGLDIFVLAFLAMTIQHWIAIRYRSFTVGVGVGIIAMLTGYAVTVMASRALVVWTRYYPWTLPMMVVVRPAVPLPPLLWFSALAGLVFVFLGCADFAHRDVA
jgi:hypothetical protein